MLIGLFITGIGKMVREASTMRALWSERLIGLPSYFLALHLTLVVMTVNMHATHRRSRLPVLSFDEHQY